MSPKLSPLDIPEILEQILSHVDDVTIGQSAILVNKAWFLLSRHRSNQDIFIDTSRCYSDLNKIMARLPEATRLWWHSEYGRNRRNQWLKLANFMRIKDLRFRESNKGSAPRKGKHTGTIPFISETTTQAYGFKEHAMRNSSNVNNAVEWTMLERPLLELHLSGFLNIQDRLPLLLPWMGFLTVLKLNVKPYNDVSIGQILTMCPDLMVLHIRSYNIFRLLGRWIPDSFDSSPFLSIYSGAFKPLKTKASSEQDATIDPKKVVRLRELVLERVHFFQADLHSLLCYTPYLDTLCLHNLCRGSGSGASLLDYDIHNLIRFLQHPQFPHPHLLPLRSFSFSVLSRPSSTQNVQHAHTELCRTSQEWILFTGGISMDLIKYLREEVPNVITTLELKFSHGPQFSLDSVLHRYLCSSPHLLHLKAPDTFYLVEHLDIHGRIETSATQTLGQRHVTGNKSGTHSLVDPPGIWLCKNLQTLHISFRLVTSVPVSTLCTTDSHAVSHGSLSYTHPPKINSRIVFGYISRVCPHLKDLQIRATENFYWGSWIPYGTWASLINRQRLNFSLDSGFCLLARLRSLERLTFGYIMGTHSTTVLESQFLDWSLEPVDVDWILESGHRDINRRIARKCLVKNRWGRWLAEERLQDLQSAMDAQWGAHQTRKTDKGSTLTDRLPIQGRTDPEIHAQLKNLGLLIDVKAMLDEMEEEDTKMETGGFKCWPMLRWMKIYHTTEYGRSKEKEVKRMLSAPKEPELKKKATQSIRIKQC
ncbi:hypothetical protein FBU30_009702 [Linnemannia zychae]|nr:hypothetical protein FBU30_009702 [Linnemannia zychae]